MEGKVINMNNENVTPKDNGAEKLSNEQLQQIAQQAYQQAEVWKQRAYEANAKLSRIELILNCLNMNIQYMKEKVSLFDNSDLGVMTTELIHTLYPPQKPVKAEDKDVEKTEEVN